MNYPKPYTEPCIGGSLGKKRLWGKEKKRKEKKRHTDWKIKNKTILFRDYLVIYMQDSKGFIKQLELLSKNKKVSVFKVKI